MSKKLEELTIVNELSLTIGLIMLTIGNFLGGMWANESWGRYWGWDPKETWALISIIIYAAVLHLRIVPKLGSKWLFNLMSIVAFSFNYDDIFWCKFLFNRSSLLCIRRKSYYTNFCLLFFNFCNNFRSNFLLCK